MTKQRKVRTAVNTAGKQRRPSPAKCSAPGDNMPAVMPSETEQPPERRAYIVSGAGTDADIAERCATTVEGWDALQEQSKADMVRLMRQFWEMPAPPRVGIHKDEGNLTIGLPEGGNATLLALRQVEAMGSKSQDYYSQRVRDLTAYRQANSRGGASTENISADLAFVHGGNPEDTVQSTLLIQMAATHDAAMRALERLGDAQYMETAKLYGNLAPKLLNAFTRQAETLHKLQRGGEQVVRHIYVDNRYGGQAVVAEQFIKGGSDGKSGDPSHALSAAVWSENAHGHPLQVSGDPGPQALSHAQRQGEGEAGE